MQIRCVSITPASESKEPGHQLKLGLVMDALLETRDDALKFCRLFVFGNLALAIYAVVALVLNLARVVAAYPVLTNYQFQG